MPGNHQGGRPMLVLAPHPDDETFGCGGAIWLFTSAHGRADVAFVTRGECGAELFEPVTDERKVEIAATRTREAAAACEILGVQQHFFLSGIDGAVAKCPSVGQDIVQLLQTTEYGRIFCPWAGDRHIDHQATFQWLKQALTITRPDCDIWLYEIWTPLVPNLVLPLGAAMDHKKSAIFAHASQLRCASYVDGFIGLAAYRGMTAPPAKYAEAFDVTTAEAVIAGKHG